MFLTQNKRWLKNTMRIKSKMSIRFPREKIFVVL